VYFAGPLFTGPERSWNADLTVALRAAGHQVFLPQEKGLEQDAAAIFAADVAGIDWADAAIGGAVVLVLAAGAAVSVRRQRHRQTGTAIA